MKDTRNEYIRQWLLKAEEDLLVVNTLIEQNFSAKASICFQLIFYPERFRSRGKIPGRLVSTDGERGLDIQRDRFENKGTC